MYSINDFAMMTPMKYYNNEDASVKRNEILNNAEGNFIATEKHDGDWGMFIHYSKGHNLIRSRSLSKVTGVYGDYTDKVPHLCAEMDTWPDNTVVLAELCFKTYNNCNGVGTILRCLPAKAVERQKDNPLYAYVFDILMYDGQDLTNVGYYTRIVEWARFVSVKYNNDVLTPNYFKRTTIFCAGIDFQEAADEIISAGGEGIVIQRKDNHYMPGTRTAWKTLKLKQSLPEMELKVLDTIEPNEHYEGDCLDTWPYWKQGFAGACNAPTNKYPVTKPFYFGWKNGVVVDYNGIECSVTSGLTDADREWLASDEAEKMIKNSELYAVIKGMSTNDKGAIRHPYLVRLRNDIC